MNEIELNNKKETKKDEKTKQEEKKARTLFNKAYLAKDQYERSKKAYGKTIMGFSENTINKGKNFINNLFKKK